MHKFDDLLRRRWLAPVLLTLAAAAAYGHTFDVPWYFDDIRAIVKSTVVQDLGRAFGRVLAPRGLANLSFALNYHWGGTVTQGYHMVNILIHLGVSWLVFLLLRRVSAGHSGPPLFGALLFLLHPLQTQAVTYVVQRMTSLSALFFFLAVWLYVRFLEISGGRRLYFYGVALLAGALAVSTKENAAILPIALLLFDLFYGPRGRRVRDRILLVVPFSLAPVWLGFNMVLAPALGGKSLQSIGTAEVLGSAVTVTPLQYLVTEWKVLWLYLKLLVVPVGQALEYGYPVAESLLSPVHLVAGVGLALLLGAAVVLRTRLPGLSFGIFWFFITLSVESTLIPLDPVYEHRLYVPMFGFVVALLAVGNQIRPYLPRPALPVLTVMILLVTGGLTWQRNQEWRDPVALWSSNLSVSQGSYRPFIGLADAYFQQGREEEAMQAYRHMLKRYEAEELHSQVNTRYLLNISVAYERMGQFEGAERILKQVLAMNPGYAEGAYNLGVVLYRQGRLQEALVYFDRARRLAPGDPKALNNYGFVALELGQVEIARQVLQPLARLSPRMSIALETEISSYETSLEPASP